MDGSRCLHGVTADGILPRKPAGTATVLMSPCFSESNTMQLDRLSIINYKNIQTATLNFSAKLNCFIGHNGEGKTNLLDAQTRDQQARNQYTEAVTSYLNCRTAYLIATGRGSE